MKITKYLDLKIQQNHSSSLIHNSKNEKEI